MTEDPHPPTDGDDTADGTSYRVDIESGAEEPADGSSYRPDDEPPGESDADGTSYRSTEGADEDLGEADGESYRRLAEEGRIPADGADPD